MTTLQGASHSARGGGHSGDTSVEVAESEVEVAVRRLVLREGEEWGRVGDHCGGWGDEPDLIWDVCIRTHIL